VRNHIRACLWCVACSLINGEGIIELAAALFHARVAPNKVTRKADSFIV